MTDSSNSTDLKRKAFYQELKKAIINLYDPTILRKSSLLEWLGLPAGGNQGLILQDVIIQSIEILKPNQKLPLIPKTWRTYQVLRQRYIEQVNQEEVAANLNLSLRQVQREEKLAREILTDYLWNRYHLDDKPLPAAILEDAAVGEGGQPGSGSTQDGPGEPTLELELEHLKSSVPQAKISPMESIHLVLDTLQPFAQRLQVDVSVADSSNGAYFLGQKPVFHQAMTNLLLSAIKICAGESLLAATSISGTAITISISGKTRNLSSIAGCQDALAIARRFLELCGGQFCLLLPDQEGDVFEARVDFPAERGIPVLIIDDNSDVLQLLRRYLMDSTYQPITTQDPKSGLNLALQMKPGAIILDVMMPEQDGWMILSQLREHPETREIPVIVSTILPQRDLAFILGVTDFIQKPFSQATLLEALDRNLSPAAKTPGPGL